jgi:hypothetical protein
MAVPGLLVDLHPANVAQPPIRIPDMGVVVIRDYLGNEIALVQLLPSGHITACTAASKDFKQRLHEAGIESRVEVIRTNV